MLALLQQFGKYLNADGKSPRTIESYLNDVQDFMNSFVPSIEEDEDGAKEVSQLKRQQVTTYRTELLRRELKPSTINKKVNSLSCFCTFLKEKGILPESENPVIPKKDRVKVALGSETEVAVFSEEEVAKILNYVGDQKKTSLRNKLLIYLLLYTGARVSEIVGIRIKDIDTITSELQIVGKGGKVRTVPLREDVLDLVKEYLRTERQESPFRESPYLLLSQRAPKMHRDAVNTLLERMSDELGFKCHPHKFRHTYCSRLVKRNVPLTTVAKLAGHASVTTTANYYVSTSRQDKFKAVNLL